MIIKGNSRVHPHSHSHNNESEHRHTRSIDNRSGFKPSENDMDKLRSTLKQFVRDWSAEVSSPQSGEHYSLPRFTWGGTRKRSVLQTNERSATSILLARFGIKEVTLCVNVSMWMKTLFIRGELRVLVPGAGLGRLAWDIAHLGKHTRLNESRILS